MSKKLLSVLVVCALLLGVMPMGLAVSAAELPEPVLSADFDDETLGGGSVGNEAYGVGYGDGVKGKALYISNRPGGSHLYGKDAQNYAEFTLPDGTLSSGSYTVSAWYRSSLSEFVEGVFFSNLTDASCGLNLYTSGTQQLQAKIGNVSATPLLNWQTAPMTAVIADREWHHAAVSVNRDTNKVTVYIDGAAYAERSVDFDSAATIGGDVLTVGARGYDKKLGLDSAYVDELAVYGSALSAAEIGAVYSETALPLLAERYSEAIANIKADGAFYTESTVGYLNQGITGLSGVIADSSLTLSEKQAAMNEFVSFYNSVMYNSAGADFELAATSDTHVEEVSYVTRFENFLKDIKTAQPESKALIVAGDLTNNGTQAEFNKYFNAIKNNAPAGMPVFSAMGNHDVRGRLSGGAYEGLGDNFNSTTLNYYLNGAVGAAGLETGYDKPYYHKVVNGYHFFVLNTETGLKDNSYISDAQLAWLYTELEKIKADDSDHIIDRPIFVTLHQPLPDTFAGTEAPVTDEAATDTVTDEMLDTAMNNLKQLLSGYPVVYFSGHRHDAVSSGSFIQNGENIYVNMPAATVNHGDGNDSTMLSYYVSVHGQKIRFRVRNFNTNMWLPEYETVFTLSSLDSEPEEVPADEKPSDRIWLDTLYGFKDGDTFNVTDENGNILSGAYAKTVNGFGTLDGDKALEVSGSRDWSYDYVHLPLSLKRSEAKGLLVYVKWNNNSNIAVTLTGKTADGTVKSFKPGGWTKAYPLYSTDSNTWSGSYDCTGNPTVSVAKGFEGYVYISFDKIKVESAVTELTDLALGGFKAAGVFTVGGVWAVENSLIPDSFGGQEITNKVWLNGKEATLEKAAPPVTDKIVLSSIADFGKISGYTARNEKGDASSTTVCRTVENRGALGGGKALELDFSANEYWQNTFVSIPFNAEKGAAAGMLVNIESWSNTNFRFKIFGKDAGGNEVTVGLNQYNKVPLYDTYNDRWVESSESGDANNAILPHYYFEGYVYIPFSQLNGEFEEITGVEIGSYRNGTEKYRLTVGGIYLVENAVLPGNYTEGMLTDVLINDTETVLGNMHLGDFNGDGSVDAVDFAALRKQLMGIDSEVSVDVKKDGVFNIIDLIKLKKILAAL